MSKFYLNIHYRGITATQDAAGASEEASPGHVYVSLKGDDNEEEYFGLYKPDGLIPIGFGNVETENEKQIHLLVKDLSKDTKKNVSFTKQIELTQDQYNKAIDYARKKASESNFYILGFNDCVDFTQSVYNAAGLPLYFTHVYSFEELSKLPNFAAVKMEFKYGSRDVKDNVLLVDGLSKEDVASRLNIPVDRIESLPQAPVHSNIAALDMKLDTFRVRLNESDFLPKILVKTVDSTIQSNEAKQDNQLPSSSSVQLQNHTTDEEFNLITLLSSLGLGTTSKVFEQLQDLNRVEKKCIELLEENELKAKDILNDFIDHKNKVSAHKQKCCHAERDRMLQQIQNECVAYNQQIFAQKQAELDSETNAALAAARATAGNSGSFTFSNADIAARKQSEYNSLINQYKAQCETKAMTLASTCKEQCNEINRAEENEVKSKIDLMKTEAKKLVSDVNVLLKEVKEKAMRGEDINIDAVINNLDAKMSAHVADLKQIVGNATVNVLFEVLYDNPVLNHPKLITAVAKRFGINGVNKLIDFGKTLENKNSAVVFWEQCESLYCLSPHDPQPKHTVIELGVSGLTKDLYFGDIGQKITSHIVCTAWCVEDSCVCNQFPQHNTAAFSIREP